MPKTKDQPRGRDDPDQSRLFIKKAREIGADEEHSAADELLGALHQKPPTPRSSAPKSKRRSTQDGERRDKARRPDR